MNTYAVVYREQKYRNIARTISGIVGVLLLVLLFLKVFTYPDSPPPGQSGVKVIFGEREIGKGEEVSAPLPVAAAEETKEEAAVEAESEEVIEPEESKSKVTESKAKDVIADQKSKQRALKKAKEEAERKKKNQAAKEQKAAAAKKKAAEEKKRKADDARKQQAAQQAEIDRLKEEGNTEKPGSQGNPKGDSNTNNLGDINTGTGMVGDGLGNRGGTGPKISDNSQETGRVVVKICVDSSGEVVSAKSTIGGSTTSSSHLKRVATANAQKWSFQKGELDKQCGTITYDFKVK